MEAARKTARDHISHILRSYPTITFPRHFVSSFVIFIHVASARRENKYSVQREKKTQREATLRFFFLNAGTGLYHSFLFFFFFLPFLFFLLFRFNFVLFYPFFPLLRSSSFIFFFFFSWATLKYLESRYRWGI